MVEGAVAAKLKELEDRLKDAEGRIEALISRSHADEPDAAPTGPVTAPG